MKFKIDLKIFLITFLFFMTSQIKIYITMMICAILHELGHLIMGIILGMKPEKLEIIPIGIRITFKLNIKDINKKVKKANKLEIKKILIAIAGPAINILLIIISATTKINFIYANLLLAIINLVPIYPLDGGRILKGIITIFKGKQKGEQTINIISIISTIITTIIGTIAVINNKNIAIIFFIIYIWAIVIKENKKYKNRKIIYELLEKNYWKNRKKIVNYNISKKSTKVTKE
mgnify:CR=1 FL=1